MTTFRYQVQRGETLNSIATKYGLPVQDLLQANTGGTPLKTGQTITVPGRGKPPGNPTNPWGQLFKTIQQQSKTSVDPFAAIGGDPLKNLIDKGLHALGPGLDFTNIGKGWNTGQKPAISPVGSSPSPYPANMPQAEQRDFQANNVAIGSPGFTSSASYRGGIDLNRMLSGGYAPSSVSPYVANYINQQAISQGYAPIYDQNGHILPGAVNGSSGDTTGGGGGYGKQYGPIKGKGWQTYENKAGYTVTRNAHGTLLKNKKQQRAAQHEDKPERRSRIGQASFRVGSG